MYLFGASGHAKVIVDIIESVFNFEKVLGVFDDNHGKQISSLNIPFLGKYNPQFVDHSIPILISIGDNQSRKVISRIVVNDFFSVIHKSAIVSKNAHIGKGTAVMANATIQPHSQIGDHCIINTAAIVEHDCQIEDYVHISPNTTITGNIRIGEGTHVGANATIIPNITIGKWCIIGAGAVIIRDVPDYAVVIGNPGKIIKFNTPTKPKS